ncbi:MAG: hypothetical protein WB699_09775, partial [Bacteroidota bacterium]
EQGQPEENDSIPSAHDAPLNDFHQNREGKGEFQAEPELRIVDCLGQVMYISILKTNHERLMERRDSP